MAFKVFLFLALAPTCLSERNGYSYLVGRHPGMIPVKLESHWPKGLGGDSN